MQSRTIYITEFDLERLEDLLSDNEFSSRDKNHIHELQNELLKGMVVAPHRIPADVITMNSAIRIQDLDSVEESVFSLVFPNEADLELNKISILAPIGTALLGYSVGDIIEYRVPAGMRRLIVKDILYQPEAAGDYKSVGILSKAFCAQLGSIEIITMELFKNKASKKYFISIDEVNADKLMMITPEGEVKPLEIHLFEGPVIKSEDASAIHRYVNQRQMKRYNQYLETLIPR